MNETLYELTGEYIQLFYMLYDDEAEDEAIVAACESIEGQIEDKADGYAKVIKSVGVSVEGIKAEIDRLQKRKASLEKKQELLKGNLESSMRAIGKTKFKTDLFSFGIQKNPPSVKIANEAEFIRECQQNGRDDLLKFKEPTINKAAVKEAITKDGELIEGAEVVQTERLVIR